MCWSLRRAARAWRVWRRRRLRSRRRGRRVWRARGEDRERRGGEAARWRGEVAILDMGASFGVDAGQLPTLHQGGSCFGTAVKKGRSRAQEIGIIDSARGGPRMIRVEMQKWGQSLDDLRRLALQAEPPRTRERFLALCLIADGTYNATSWAAQFGR